MCVCVCVGGTYWELLADFDEHLATLLLALWITTSVLANDFAGNGYFKFNSFAPDGMALMETLLRSLKVHKSDKTESAGSLRLHVVPVRVTGNVCIGRER